MSLLQTDLQGRQKARSLARDSLELASLASSSHTAGRNSVSSSASGPPSSRKLSFDDDDPLSSSNPAGGHGRSHSISSAFDFASPIFPISASGHEYTAIGAPSSAAVDPSISFGGGSLEKQKSLTYTNGLSLVIGLIIGSGIFSSPSEVNINAGSPAGALIVWVVAGTLAWTGASSYAELGGAIPLNGGAQLYLAKIFGDMVGFLYSWCTVCVLKPGSAAIIAIIFGEYAVRAVIGADAEDASKWVIKSVAIGGLALVTFLNSVSTKLAAKSADIFMFFKFVALIGITITGIVVAATGFTWEGQPSTDWKTHGWFDGTSTDLSQWAVALYAGLWAFDGWDNVNYVAGEFVTPSRDLPRVIHTSIPVVIIFYLLANTAYFLVLPLSVTSNSTTIAVAFGSKVFGVLGSFVLALTVSGSCFGALNATTFTSSRLFFAAAKEGYLPSFIGHLGLGKRRPIRLHAVAGSNEQPSRFITFFARLCADEHTGTIFYTPIHSLLLNFTITTIYIIMGTFGTLITFYGVAGYFFYFLTVVGLIVLRVKEPNLERPYKCWISTPIVFCCVSLFLLSRSVIAEPWISLGVVAFVVIGAVIYIGRLLASARSRRGKQGSQAIDWRFWKR